VFGKIRDARHLWKALGHWQKIKQEVNQVKETKNLLTSRTFWVNLLTLAASLLGVLPVPPEVALIISNVLNIGLRILTGKPVTIFPQKN